MVALVEESQQTNGLYDEPGLLVGFFGRDLEGGVADVGPAALRHSYRFRQIVEPASILADGYAVEWRILFSAHGLPEKIVDAGDPYQWQVEIFSSGSSVSSWSRLTLMARISS